MTDSPTSSTVGTEGGATVSSLSSQSSTPTSYVPLVLPVDWETIPAVGVAISAVVSALLRHLRTVRTQALSYGSATIKVSTDGLFFL